MSLFCVWRNFLLDLKIEYVVLVELIMDGLSSNLRE